MGKKKATAKKAVRISDADEKKKALEMALAHIEKDFGSGTIMRMGDNAIQDVETVSTGSIGLDNALGVGGVPRGRITEIFGAESSGKTTLAIHVIAEAQKQGGVCAIIDAEHAFDRFYAEQLGVDVNNLWISQPDNGEQALEVAEQLINSGAVDVLVIDSVAALTPKAEIEGEMGDKNVGLQARLMSQAMRKLTGAISRTRTCCIFINQTREKIGNMYGPAQTTTGGNALKFYSTVRIEITPSSVIKDSDEQPIGRIAKTRVVKNKVAPPFKKAEFDIMFGQGISKAGEIIEYGVEYGIIKKSGAWFSYGDSKIGQGKEGVRKMLNDNPELMAELEEKIRQALKDEEAESKGAAKLSPLAKKKAAEAYEAEDDDLESMAAEGDDDFFEEDFEIEE